MFGHCGHGRPRTPFCFIANVLFWYRMRVDQMDQWHLNPRDSEGNWIRTIFGTCQVSEMERIEERLAAKRMRRYWEEENIPF